MKKTLLSLLLCLAILFAATGCGTLAELSLGTAWLGSGTERSGVTETLKYSVTFDENFTEGDSYSFKKDSALDGLFYNYKNGEYTTTVSVIERFNLPDNVKESDIFTTHTIDTVYKITSELKITAVYTTEEGEKEFNDSIITKSYVCNSSSAYAPVYSLTEYDCLIPMYKEAENNKKYMIAKETNRQKYVAEIFYNSSSYTLKTFDYDAYKENPSVEPVSSKEKNYTFKTVIDNNELLFAIRNCALVKDKSAILPTISVAYVDYTNIAVKNNEELTLKLKNVSNNGAEITEEEVSASLFSFGKNDMSSGRSQLVYIQNKASKNLAMKSLLVKYVTPLTMYTGSYYCMGAMVYTLNSVEFSA